MKIPKDLQQVIDFFEKLPGIGPKSAKRLGFYLLRMPQADLEKVGGNLAHLKSSTHYCARCLNLSEDELCSICTDPGRDPGVISVVEDVLDLISFETGNHYTGVYHVLHGRIDPLNYVGPDDIFIPQLIERIKNERGTLKEIILATNPNTEGEATAMFIKQRLHETLNGNFDSLKITRLAYGLPIGADLEYADYMTIKHSLEGRRDF
ncbi:recombination protein RecR [Candidatus Roizmanbacteria bacterium RIFCSPLOWO2_02_FULL_43_10]|uniref:Recombination protein RecR n=2 Tax=Candidatus Roizmaniibacteriota TaxID=1752723 RepID=A0A1F7JTE8_9BACT|nr:MAG: recombination protein RecR [Candidatus Roizmanbacteria bacterium RIFCSPHIGHO2_02_FULL_43_11]OGK58894.1 MAG: recombination protein RecR [Candidatus Roizmanbacteria bacterium RIFCSPLOWO2_02_FULL_43_10]